MSEHEDERKHDPFAASIRTAGGDASMTAGAQTLGAFPSELADANPFFIVGAARSGTSLLSRIMNSHPHIAVPFESHIYHTFLPWLRHYGDLSRLENMACLLDDILATEMLRHWSPPADRAATLSAIRRHDLHGLVDGLFSSWARAQGKQRWGEKTPSHVRHWRQILQGFPEARFLHVVRDGRDVSLSWIEAPFGPKNLFYAAQRWREYLAWVAELRAAVPAGQLVDVHYAELLAEPERTLERICEFLGEPFDPAMLEYYREAAPYPTDARNIVALDQPLLRDNSGKWRETLTPDELRVFETIAGDALEQYGYPLVAREGGIRLAEQLRYRALHPPQRALAMLRNRPGHREHLRKLALYVRLRLGRRPRAR